MQWTNHHKLHSFVIFQKSLSDVCEHSSIDKQMGVLRIEEHHLIFYLDHHLVFYLIPVSLQSQ